MALKPTTHNSLLEHEYEAIVLKINCRSERMVMNSSASN